jgi:diguanylate cyclase (GGDEF)-like protein/PAS domain S-box-containing protein
MSMSASGADPFADLYPLGFNETAVGMLILDRALQILHVNPAASELLGRPPAELLGRSVLDFTHPDDRERSAAWQGVSGARPDGVFLDKRYVRGDGSILHAAVTSTLLRPAGGEPCFFSQLLDMTSRRRSEQLQAAITEVGRLAVESSDIATLLTDSMRIVRTTLGTLNCMTTRRLASGEVRAIAGDGDVPVVVIPADRPSQTRYTLSVDEPVICPEFATETRFSTPPAALPPGVGGSISVRVPERSGPRTAILAHASADARAFTAEDANFLEVIAHILGGALDRDATEQELRRRALEDPLTGLANRALLISHVEAELRHARRLGDRVSVVVAELDRFKVVNDALGRAGGDNLLRQIAARLSGSMREEDLIARPGGDEFAVVCVRTDSDHAIAEVAHRVVAGISEPFDVGGQEVFLTASVGVAVAEHGRATPEQLLRDADNAMIRAKEMGGGRYEVFDVAMRDRLVKRVALESELRHACERGQLELHYQPLIALADERITGFEALLRWRHPERGLVGPGEFIPIAEETGLIIEIGDWVVQQACNQLARWPESVSVSVNLSAVQLRTELVDLVQAAIADAGIAPRRLVLEITESLVLDPRTKPIVDRLRALGAKLALDDFGTGYSSLGSLQRFAMDIVKLDRTLIESLADGRGVAVVRAAVELGEALGVSVVAEGIEGVPQLDALRELGCAIGQGFLFARPLPLDEADRLLADPRRTPAGRAVADA